MADGCNEKIDKEFLWWIIHEGRDKTHQKRYQKLYEKYPKKLIVLKNPRAVKKFTQKLSLM
jgi:hypothetical protein